MAPWHSPRRQVAGCCNLNQGIEEARNQRCSECLLGHTPAAYSSVSTISLNKNHDNTISIDTNHELAFISKKPGWEG